MQDKAYRPVDIIAAKEIADKYDKQVVVIVCVDEIFNLVHTTSYGTNANAKVMGAVLADLVQNMIGDVSEKKVFSDFRTLETAHYVQRIDELEKEIKKLNEDNQSN